MRELPALCGLESQGGMISEMQIVPPTNWDNRLVEEFKSLDIKEVYGKLPVDYVGGGRTGFSLPCVSKRNAAIHIRKFQDEGIQFNYLLNASCLGFREFTHSGRAKILKVLNWLRDAGVSKVTVTIPYLLQLIKERYPDFKVGVSTIANVDCLDKAKFWESIGADSITLVHTSLNRNFKQLRLIREKVKCELRLIANDACLYRCPISQYHYLKDSHGSQKKYYGKAGFTANYCFISCRYLRLMDPVKVISTQWIRPEDLNIYEKIGIDSIKLVDRMCSTEKIVEITRSYINRHYDGNLIGLFPLYQGRSPVNKRNFWIKLRYFFHPFETNIFNILKLKDLMEQINIYIDNRKLDGFINRFLEQDCRSTDCSECDYCRQVAERVIEYDKKYLETEKNKHKQYLDDIIRGKF